jgi:hypothetical protein
MKVIFITALVVFLALFSVRSCAEGITDPRYCGKPIRTASGEISRSVVRIAEFRSIHPCPVTGKSVGSCPGWSIDHIIPLACGGCDKVFNMQWLPNYIKNTSNKYSKDRWERKVYGKDIEDTNNCTNKGINYE